MANTLSEISVVVTALLGVIILWNGSAINISETQKYFWISTILTVIVFIVLNNKIDAKKR